MKKLVTLLAVLAFVTTAFAQYSSPSDVTYDAASGVLYVANQGKGEIIKNDNGTNSTFISGLTKPNAIAFGSLPAGSGILVADSNVLRAYTTAGSLLITISFPGAIELSDMVADPKTNAIFVSDQRRGYIYKLTFGPAPFYLPNVANFLTTGLKNPASMYMDAAKRSLMIVSMVNNTPVQRLNVDTKKLDTAYSTSISMANGIERDTEGNYYISSWSSNYVYQLNKYLTSVKKMSFYNKPAKFHFDAKSDYLHFTCYGCGKLEKVKIHNFAPDYDIEKCAGDSFVAYRSSLVNNYGCYTKDNKFILQVSDKNGSFTKPQNLVVLKDTAIPWVYNGKVPEGMASGTYKYRIISTHPETVSSWTKNLVVKAKPEAAAYISDTAYHCIGDSVKLGKTNPEKNVRYDWWKSAGLSNDTVANPYAKVNGATTYQMLAVHRLTGCKTRDSVVVIPISNPPTNFKDTIRVCKGENVKIGTETNSGFKYNWTPGKLLNDSTHFNPLAEVRSSTWFHVTVGSGSCSSKDSVYVQVNSIPELSSWQDTFWKCKEKAIVIGSKKRNLKVNYKWAPPSGINKDTAANPECFTQESKAYELLITNKETGCKKEYRAQVMVYEVKKPTVSELNDSTLICSEDADSFVWYRNEMIINNNSKTLKVSTTANYQVRIFTKNGCTAVSDKFRFEKINSLLELERLGVQLFPNPFKDKIQVNSVKSWSIIIRDGIGREVFSHSAIGSSVLDLDALKKGTYYLQVDINGFVKQVVFVKSE